MKYPIAKIWVDRENRQRRELVGIDELMHSIAKYGQLQNITITREGKLICGERRFTAMTNLGYTEIDVRFLEDLSESELQMIELEENVRRVDITWQERAAAMQRYVQLAKAENPDITLDEIATELNTTPSTVSNYTTVAEKLNDPKIAKLDKLSTALNTVRREKAREVAAIGVTVRLSAPLLNADFSEWAPAYSGPKFNFLHCDFPYGINADNQQQGNNTTMFGGYADSPDIYWSLLRTLSASMENVVAESAHLMFWFSMDYYQSTLDALTEMGWRVNPFPLIWHKSDNTGLLPDPNRGPRRTYETAFLASRGDRPIVQPVANSFAARGRDKSIHMSEKPTVMLAHFFRMFVDQSTFMLDPTAGSANAVRVAKHLNAHTVLGLEINSEFYSRAVEVFNDPIQFEDL